MRVIRPTGINPSLKLYARMNGANDSTFFGDDSSAHNTITANGSAKISTASSKFGGSSAYFNGSLETDYLSFPALDITGDYTVRFWANVSTATSAYDAMVADESFTLSTSTVIFIDTGGKVNIYRENASKIVSSSTINGAWHHISLIRVSGTTRLYVDGVKEGVDWTSNTATLFDNAGYVGYDTYVSGGTYLTGYIDDLQVWDRALDGTVIPKRQLI